MKQQDKLFMGIGGSVVALLAIATGVYLFGNGDDSQNLVSGNTTSDTTAVTASNDTTTSAGSSSTTSTSSMTSSSTYKEGTYSATVSYYVPHGTNSLTAKVTVSGKKITSVSVNDDYSDHESAMYIDSFESAIKSAVVGRDLGSLSLSRVGGATLTTQAFDDALTTIRNDAKA